MQAIRENNAFQLLIVPCGIEIPDPQLLPLEGELLIVPCGIEMGLAPVVKRLLEPFNRTMWN